MTRRLAAILFTDVVGYTALMGRDEAAARRVRARHEALVRDQVGRYHGEWIEEKGDESLSVFPSALQAVNCALAIQAEILAGAEFALRIGIHLGDVTVEAGRVYGDGVNVAARIRPLAEPGGIAVSAPVHDSIKNQPGIRLRALGERSLKNVAAPMPIWFVTGTASPSEAEVDRPAPRKYGPLYAIAAFAIIAILGAFWWTRPVATPATAIRSLAVLPLHDPSADEHGAFFSFGMTEALIAELAKLTELRVISRTSVTPYEDTTLPIQKIAAELGVEGIIEGSVVRSGDQIRITAQLIDARTDTHLWADSYDSHLGDVLETQAEIARAIARQVQLEVAPASDLPDQTAQARRSMSPEAYEAYLKGFYFQMKRTREDTIRALQYFTEVIRLEPEHPLGYSGLADEYSCAPTHAWSIAESELWPSVPTEMVARARENAQKALELDPTSSAAHTSIALVRTFGDWDWAGAEVAFRKALDLAPSNHWAHYAYFYLLAFQGRFEEAREHVELALALDPIRLDYTMALAALNSWTDRPEEAYYWWKKAEEIDPTYPGLHQAVISGFCGTERHEEATDALAGANTKYPEDPLILAETAYCDARAGDPARARALLTELESWEETSYVSPVSSAMLHVGLGDHEAAIDALERGIRERAFLIPWLAIDNTWDPLRADPRFADLIERIGLPRRDPGRIDST
jgi:adenylate cyclase